MGKCGTPYKLHNYKNHMHWQLNATAVKNMIQIMFNLHLTLNVIIASLWTMIWLWHVSLPWRLSCQRRELIESKNYDRTGQCDSIKVINRKMVVDLLQGKQLTYCTLICCSPSHRLITKAAAIAFSYIKILLTPMDKHNNNFLYYNWSIWQVTVHIHLAISQSDEQNHTKQTSVSYWEQQTSYTDGGRECSYVFVQTKCWIICHLLFLIL